MDILPLLDELQIIARNGLNYAQNPYDRERYERLMELTKRYYGEALDLSPAAVRERLSKELGYVTRRLGPMRRSSTRLGRSCWCCGPTTSAGACPAAGSSPTRARSRQRCARRARRQDSR